MTNNAEAQIAREWAVRFIKHADSAQIVDADALTAARHILATTTPPTMAEVKWDNEVHAGLCAEHPKYGLVRMMYADGGMIDCILPDMSLLMISAKDLTPLPGTRVDLTPRRESEPESTPDHPAVLTTEEDYKNAPIGTVAAEGISWTKVGVDLWENTMFEDRGDLGMSARPRRVLRWGEAL